MAPQKGCFPYFSYFWSNGQINASLTWSSIINTIILSNPMISAPVLLHCLMLLLLSFPTKPLYKGPFWKKEETHNTSFSPSSSSFFLPGQKIVTLHSFSLENTSEKLAVLNLGELFRLNYWHLSQVNLAFRLVV